MERNINKDKVMMGKKLAVFLLLNGLICSPNYADEVTAIETVKLFYKAATTEGMCDTAIKIRTGYTLEQCRALKRASIRRLKVVKETEDEAILYLNMKYVSNKTQRFSGHIHLYKKDGNWVIIGSDYKSRRAMSRSRYIRTYLGTAKKTLSPKKKPESIEDTLSGNHRAVIDKLVEKYPNFAKTSVIVLVDISEQELYLYQKKYLKRVFSISSSSEGEGIGSNRTPLGAHIVKQKIGKGLPLGTIFIDNKATDKTAEIHKQSLNLEDDNATSRVIRLAGLEPKKNQGGEADSFQHNIAIQGTDEEGLIGRKASHGSIRMYNKDVIELFDKLPKNSLVYIGR